MVHGESRTEESRIERKKAETRQKIINVSLELFARQGFRNTTMEQIAQEADIARKTLYNYYPVKEAIADDYLRGVSLGLAAECRREIAGMAGVKEQLLHALLKVYGWVAEHPELAEAAFYYRLKKECQPQEETGTQMISTEILHQGQANGMIRDDVSVEYMAGYLNILRGSVLMKWLQQPDGSSLAEMVAVVLDMFLFGVGTDACRSQAHSTAQDQNRGKDGI